MTNSLTQAFNPLDIARQIDDSDVYFAELMRNNVKEIIGSYHYQFDHLYECIQNAVDACDKAFSARRSSATNGEYSPLVKIKVNLQENSVTIVDNGRGMPKEVVLRYFFTPYATLKTRSEGEAATRQRGEKGVGAAFLSYGSNFIHLSTKSMTTGELTSGKLEDGLKWCNGEIDLIPMPQVKPWDPSGELDGLEHGTVVTIQFSEDTNIGYLKEHGTTLEQWEAILRLHTALGYVDLDGNDPFLELLRGILVLVDEDGNLMSKPIRTGYMYPHLATEANVRLSSLIRDKKGRLRGTQSDMNIVWDTFTYDEVSSLVTTRMEQIRYLRRRKRQRLSDILNLHRPEAYVAFTYANEFWEERNHEVWGEEGIDQFRHGIVFATKSQKIGEQKRIDFKFRSGDFNRFFVLLSMQNLKGDIGRKSLREESASLRTSLLMLSTASSQRKMIALDQVLAHSVKIKKELWKS